uniref:Uncharacterized protein n=1 Tax=Tetranychus urticae TaxID=32264 RepID=T1KNC4_TETUR
MKRDSCKPEKKDFMKTGLNVNQLTGHSQQQQKITASLTNKSGAREEIQKENTYKKNKTLLVDAFNACFIAGYRILRRCSVDFFPYFPCFNSDGHGVGGICIIGCLMAHGATLKCDVGQKDDEKEEQQK